MINQLDLAHLEENLGVKFKKHELLSQALVHRSHLNEDASTPSSNERLEFLGDSVLSLVTSTFLYHHFKDYAEGKLTATRSILVQSRTLARVASDLELGNFLLMSKGEEQSGGRKNVSLLADSFEAVIGAMYLDQGLEIVEKFLKTHLLSKMDDFLSVREVMDFKSQLQEHVQETKKLSPAYFVVKTEGPDHAKLFYVEVKVEEATIGIGSGKSKQEAEQNAARNALEKLT